MLQLSDFTRAGSQNAPVTVAFHPPAGRSRGGSLRPVSRSFATTFRNANSRFEKGAVIVSRRLAQPSKAPWSDDEMIKASPPHQALSDRVHAAIQASPFVSRRNLRFETDRGRVVLQGEVRSFFQKQMAQEAVRGLDGVHAIDNQLEVSCR